MTNQWLCFAGQGSQVPGMGQARYGEAKTFRRFVDRADEILDGVIAASFDDPSLLNQTRSLQPILVALMVAEYEQTLAEQGLPEPSLVFGHSLGELPALYVAGVIPFEALITFTKLRADLMADTWEQRAESSQMVAVIGIERNVLDRKLQELKLSAPDIIYQVATYNAKSAFGVSCIGVGDLIAPLKLKLSSQKQVRIIPINTSAPFHSFVFDDLVLKFEWALSGIGLKEPCIPWGSNTLGRRFISGEDDLIDVLALQPAAEVLFYPMLKREANPPKVVFEIAAKRTLSSLIRRMDLGAGLSFELLTF